jgi:hypothetical protein
MSQPATEAPERGRAAAGGGNALTRKMAGVPVWGWIAIVAAGAGAFLWWRNRKSSAAAAAGSTQPQAATATCYDANGNTVDCASPMSVGSNATDYFEALYTQNEGINGQLETITPTINETGQDVDTLQTQIANLGGPPSTGPPGTRPQNRPGPVTDLTVDVISPTLARVSWRPPQFASHAPTSTTYTIQIVGKDRAPHGIGSRTSYNVGGLRPGEHYTATVAPVGGPSSSKSFTTPKSAARVTTPSKAA